jgi:hypothetical protein
MSLRFTETNKWSRDRWFMDLSANGKLLFIYLYENCDIAGFLEVSSRKMSFDVNLSIEETMRGMEEISKCYLVAMVGENKGEGGGNGGGMKEDSGRIVGGFKENINSRREVGLIFIKKFLFHQKNLPLNENNRAHITILKLLNSNLSKFGFQKIDDFFDNNIILNNNLKNIRPSIPLDGGGTKEDGRGIVGGSKGDRRTLGKGPSKGKEGGCGGKQKLKVENENNTQNVTTQNSAYKIESPFQSEKFLHTWNEWLIFRKQARFPSYNQTSEQQTLYDLCDMAEGEENKAIAIIHQSIRRHYKDFFPIKDKPNQEGITDIDPDEAAKKILNQ